jgi:hypothetical protein
MLKRSILANWWKLRSAFGLPSALALRALSLSRSAAFLSALVIAGTLVLFVPSRLPAQTELIGRSETKELTWGGVKHRWHDIYSARDVKIAAGPLGRLDVVLADNAPAEGNDTDLLLHFDECERDRLVFVSTSYRAEKVDLFPSGEIRKHGTCAAGFLSNRNTVQMKPLADSLFFEGDALKSFTIDFFLFPLMFADGSVVLSWHAPVVSLGGNFTGIRAYAEQGRLTWQLERVFKKRNGDYVDVVIRENRSTPLNEWHHHALFYDADAGLISLFFDGRESSLGWVTETGGQRGTLLLGKISPFLGLPISLGESYSGYLDEFRISRGLPLFFTGDYRPTGEIRSEAIDLAGPGTKLVKVSWASVEENGTAVRVYCRISDTFFLPAAEPNERIRRIEEGGRKGGGDAVSEDGPDAAGRPGGPADPTTGVPGHPSWVQVRNGEVLSGRLPAGRYLQWKAVLLGTGGDSPFVRGTGSTHTPVLISLTVVLEPDDPPLMPAVLKAVPLNGGVRITWLRNKESDIQGYRIYYGSASKYYFGKGADLGESPVTVGNVGSAVLKGLTNEEVYFLAVTALDASGQESGFSRELVVRPSKVFEGPAYDP